MNEPNRTTAMSEIPEGVGGHEPSAADLPPPWAGWDQGRRIGAVAGAVIACALLGWLAAGWVGPNPPELSARTSGDEALATEVERLLGDDRRGLDAMAVAVLDEGETTHAGFGAGRTEAVGPDTAFEIGSVTKTFTGMLLADFIDKGELDPDQSLRTLTGGEAREGEDGDTGGDASLEALASHRAGYPRLPTSVLPRALLARYAGSDPYTGGRDDILDSATDVDAASGDYAYSNLGMAALGNALAVHASRTYADLVGEELLEPLGMDATVFPTGSDIVSPRVEGHDHRTGSETAPWRAPGWQPAGVGVWSTTEDLSRFLGAVMDRSAPGAEATRSRYEIEDERSIGYGWFTTTYPEADGASITWHNGGTGGFRSWVGYDPDSRRGAVVLSNTTRSVDDLGSALVFGEPLLDDGEALPARSPGLVGWLIAVMSVVGVIAAGWSVPETLRTGRGAARQLIDAVATMAIVLTLTRLLAPWDLVSTSIWAGAAALGVAITGAAIWAGVRKPTASESWVVPRWIATITGVGLALVLVGATVA